MTLDHVRGNGLFMVADPHLADPPPGQRLDGYIDQIMSKLTACLDRADALGMVPVILGDLFHWPRDNSNKMLVDLIRLFGSRTGDAKVRVLVGNHDKYQSRFTDDVSLAVLETANAVVLMKEHGPQFILDTPDGEVLVGASPDGAPLPKGYERGDGDPATVVWLTHHNIQFPEFEDRAYSIRELPGIDWLINGHIHRPQPTVVKGQTTWANPGNITRLTFTRRSMVREPAAAIWTPGCEELEKWVVPYLPFTRSFSGSGPAARGAGNGRGIQFHQGAGAVGLAAHPRGHRAEAVSGREFEQKDPGGQVDLGTVRGGHTQ